MLIKAHDLPAYGILSKHFFWREGPNLVDHSDQLLLKVPTGAHYIIPPYTKPAPDEANFLGLSFRDIRGIPRANGEHSLDIRACHQFSQMTAATQWIAPRKAQARLS